MPLYSFAQKEEAKKALAKEYYQTAEHYIHPENDFYNYLKYAKKADPLLKETEQLENYIWNLVGMMNVHNYVGNIKESLACAERLEEDLKNLPLAPDFYIDKVLRLAVYYVNAQHYTKARSLSQLAEDFSLSHDDLNWGQILNNFGYLNDLLGDQKQALNYYEQAVSHFEKDENIPYVQLGNTLKNMAVYYRAQQQHQKSNQYLRASSVALAKEEDYNKTQVYELSNFVFLGLNAQDQGNLKSAERIFEQALNMPNLSKSQYHRIWHQQGVNFTKQGKYELALSRLKQALQERLKRFGNKHSNVASTYEAIGDLYAAQNQLDSAALHFQNAILALVKDFDEKSDRYKNPSTQQDIVDKIDLLSPLKKKATLLRKQGDLAAALASLEVASDLIYAIRRDIFSTESKLDFTAQATEVYEKAIEVCIALYQQSQSDIYLEKMFSFKERNKATLLLESILEAEAQGASKIPETLRNELSQAKMKKASFEKALLQLDKNRDQALHEELQADLLEIDRILIDLNEELKANHKDYFQLKFQLETPSIATVRKNILRKKELFIEFFQGKDQLYAFAIGPSSTHFVQYPKAEINPEKLLSFLALFTDRDQILNAPSQYQREAQDLYQRLLLPILSAEGKTVSRLCIIPDGFLSQFPFEALIDQEGKYLIESYEIRTAYSATLLQTPRDIIKTPYKLLAVAPGFEKQERGLAPLPFSIEEVQNIPYENKRLLLKEEASLASFKSEGDQYEVLHLSTHAAANKVGIPPRIYFYEKDLLLPDLYALQLQANLVVLSACETNLGQFAQGEGMLSMARAFSQAGARNLIASQWEIMDRTSLEIINQFYSYLKNGAPIATALRKAKLDYLNNADTDLLRSPYYWASFAYINNYQASAKASYPRIYFIIGLLAIGLFLSLFLFKRT